MPQSNKHISASVETVARALLAHAERNSNGYSKEKDNPDRWYAYIPTALTVVTAQDKQGEGKPSRE